MSERDVAVVRALYEGWLAGDPGLELMDPEIAMVESPSIPGAAAVYGIDAVRRYIESFARYWEEIQFEPQEYLDAGEKVVVVARLRGRGRSSGVEVTRTWAYVWTVRDGRALRMDGYATREEALAAAGLRE